MNSDGTALLARKTWRTAEPLHGMIYFVPEAAEAYAALGITGRDGYFASRAAPMGAVSAEVVISTFFNFNPQLVHAAIPKAWATTTPEALAPVEMLSPSTTTLTGFFALSRSSTCSRPLASAPGTGPVQRSAGS